MVYRRWGEDSAVSRGRGLLWIGVGVIAVGALLASFGQWTLSIGVGALGIVLFGVGALVTGGHRSAFDRELDDLQPATRSRVAGLIKTHRDIVAMLAAHPDSVVLSGMSSSVREESEETVRQAIRLAESRREIARLLVGNGDETALRRRIAEIEASLDALARALAELRSKLASAASAASEVPEEISGLRERLAALNKTVDQARDWIEVQGR